MKKIFIIFILFSISLNSQNKKAIFQSSDSTELIKNNEKGETDLNINFPQTIQFKNISKKVSDQSLFEKRIPWIIALIIAILSGLSNIWIAKRLQKSNDQNLKRQIESSEKNSITQFKVTIATKNRQEWINELRHTISELISESIQIAFEMRINKTENKESIKKHLTKLVYDKAKIEMLVNNEKPEQKDLIDKVNDVFNQCINASNPEEFDGNKLTLAREETIVAARKLFGIHWKKIKELK